MIGSMRKLERRRSGVDAEKSGGKMAWSSVGPSRVEGQVQVGRS